MSKATDLRNHLSNVCSHQWTQNSNLSLNLQNVNLLIALSSLCADRLMIEKLLWLKVRIYLARVDRIYPEIWTCVATEGY